jgi:hypothetical protein
LAGVIRGSTLGATLLCHFVSVGLYGEQSTRPTRLLQNHF